ncbi:MAG TPA: hypothetical protein PKK59_07585 [Anaerolineaceae bacterium]|nr:hypothetical protein [Anaerolineaceae bacterium]
MKDIQRGAALRCSAFYICRRREIDGRTSTKTAFRLKSGGKERTI